MGTYEKLVQMFSKTDYTNNELENAVNETYGDLVARQLECYGYEIQGNISIHQDQNIPYLWHVYDKTHYEYIPLDYVFNVKTEVIINKFEEVS